MSKKIYCKRGMTPLLRAKLDIIIQIKHSKTQHMKVTTGKDKSKRYLGNKI